MINDRYESFEEFWPFYLSQHSNRTCRNLHVIGTSIAVIFLVFAFFTHHFLWIILAPVMGYFFAWVGHFVFEKNRPATFTYPKWSFMGDVRMLKLFFTGRLQTELQKQNLRSHSHSTKSIE